MMNLGKSRSDNKRLSMAGTFVALGIIFGNLGTSPLFAMKAVIAGGAENFNQMLIYGALSCAFWLLTISTTIKYIFIALCHDNNGEGGIFSLFALMNNKSPWIAVATMIGAAALLADSVLTPAVTVTASIEGLKLINPNIYIVPIVLALLTILFFIQKYGTNIIGKSFGPVMFLWLLFISYLGISQIVSYPAILEAINPVYAYVFITEYPGGFGLLSAVFLVITGVEIIYPFLGRSGKGNIQLTWIYVKIALILNYFGQGAWLLMNIDNGLIVNPFFSMVPVWLLVPGVLLAAITAIIASQAIITGSFTMISEAISLNFWPKMRISHTTFLRGQVYLPVINWFLWMASCLVVFFFKDSLNIAPAYGLSVNIAELVVTLLLSYYLLGKGVNHRLVLLMFSVYFLAEASFLVANLSLLGTGGWLTLLLMSCFVLIMVGWFFGRKIKNRYITFADLDEYLDLFREIVKDDSIPRFATNLVYIIRANKIDQVESKVIYSIFSKQPKRADTYWLLHVDRVGDPNSFDYQVNQIIPGILIRVDFHIGFKVEPKINLYFREVVEDMVKSGEIKLQSSYDTLRKNNFDADFKFILIERIMSRDVNLSTWEETILNLNRFVKRLSVSDERSLHLDSTITSIESVPIILDQHQESRIKRVYQ